MGKLFTYPVDSDGLVVYFAVNGRHFLFNGHKGLFYDTLPDYAVEVLSAVLEGRSTIANVAQGLRVKFGSKSENLLQQIRAYRDGTHPDLVPEQRQQNLLEGMVPSSFNVYVAQGCNLSCRYCFNQAGTFGRKPSFMSEETARDLVAFITRVVTSGQHRAVAVNLFGGEPLLAPRAVSILARGFQDLNNRNLPASVHFALSTNGTIYSKEIFDIFAERPDLSTIVVSLDAFKKAHDRNRPFPDRSLGSSYDTVVRNLSRMMHEEIPCCVTCVVPYPYDYVGAAEALHRLGVRQLEIKQLIEHIYGRRVLPPVFRNSLCLWRNKYLEYTDYYLDHLRTETPVSHVDRFSVIGDYARALGTSSESRRTVACAVADAKIAVTSDGRFMPCESFLGYDAFEIGSVRQGLDPIRHRRFEQWIISRGQHRIEHRRCNTCYAKKICGGGCYARSYDRAKRLCPLPESSCKFIREMTRIDLYYISRIRKEHPKIYEKLTGVRAQV